VQSRGNQHERPRNRCAKSSLRREVRNVPVQQACLPIDSRLASKACRLIPYQPNVSMGIRARRCRGEPSSECSGTCRKRACSCRSGRGNRPARSEVVADRRPSWGFGRWRVEINHGDDERTIVRGSRDGIGGGSSSGCIQSSVYDKIIKSENVQARGTRSPGLRTMPALGKLTVR